MTGTDRLAQAIDLELLDETHRLTSVRVVIGGDRLAVVKRDVERGRAQCVIALFADGGEPHGCYLGYRESAPAWLKSALSAVLRRAFRAAGYRPTLWVTSRAEVPS